jgi:hypothetical protein
VTYIIGKMSDLSSHLIRQGFWQIKLFKLFVVHTPLGGIVIFYFLLCQILLDPQTSKQLLQKKKDLALARSSFLGSFFSYTYRLVGRQQV